jgi:hypothetical protein
LVVDPEGERRIALSRAPYSTAVAGVFSTKPGVLATEWGMAETRAGRIVVAMLGIVPCKVTAENGPIAPGNLLVTSSVPGRAMKGTDRNRMLGAVLGKAMAPLAGGLGVIPVRVTLH